jgi:predicted ATPase/DNA-binding SARP family transcriptional activator
MTALWRVELLGDLRAQREEQVVSRFRTQKTAALLGYLAFFRQRSQPREVLIELLWPDRDRESGLRNLRVSLTSLRHQLEPPGIGAGAVVLADHHSVQLNPTTVTTDVAEFEAALQEAETADGADRIPWLEHAVDLYRGALLPGYYEAWIPPQLLLLEEQYFQAVDQLLKLLQQVGDLQRALQYAGRAVAADPLREETHMALMCLYAAAGRRPEALRQYQELERLLRAEQGTAPSDAARVLAATLQKGLPPTSAGLALRTSGVAQRTVPPGARFPESGDPSALPRARRPTPNVSLPLQLTRFFGREAEIEHLCEMLGVGGPRLVTLTGPGGSGKTRLAIEVAARLGEAFGGAVWFVPLADLTEPRRIVDSILDVLRLTHSPEVEPLEQVTTSLSRQPSLLLLDNFEHLVEGGAQVVRVLLERAPSLTCLLTSRQVLNLAGEQGFAVRPLPIPGSVDTPERLLDFASVRLFVDRAQLARSDFQVTRANARAVAELCNRLEGIPLAIELAAARANMMSPAQILGHLACRFDFLVSHRRDAEARHRTLRAAIDWSYRLLPPALQRLFARLSIFRGGWIVEAAEAVCIADSPSLRPQSADLSTLDMLTELCERSLILAEDTGAQTRFRMLETLREYAGEQFGDEERLALARRHADYFLRLAEQAEPELEGPHQAEWFERLEKEHDNLRAALEWSLEKGREGREEGREGREKGKGTGEWRQPEGRTLGKKKEEAQEEGSREEGEREEAQAESVFQSEIGNRKSEIAEAGLRLAGALARFWDVRGHFREGRERLASALSRTEGFEATSARARALNGAGILAYCQNDYDSARTLHAASLAISRKLGDPKNRARALNRLGLLSYYQGDVAAAHAFYEEGLAIQREIGDAEGVAVSLVNLGFMAGRQGDQARARSYFEESLAIQRRLGNKGGIANALHGLAFLTCEQSDAGTARALLEESLAIYRELGNKQGIAVSLEAFARLAVVEGQAERAGRLWGAGAALRKAIGVSLAPADQTEQEARLAALRRSLGEASFSLAYEAGRALTWEQAIQEALAES